MKLLLGILIFAHGLVHIPMPLIPGTDGRLGTWLMDPGRVWIVRTLGVTEAAMRQVGTTLMILATVAFLIAGLAYFGWIVPAGWWRPAAITAAAVSLTFLGLFWHPWLWVGAALDVAIALAAILRWMPAAR